MKRPDTWTGQLVRTRQLVRQGTVVADVSLFLVRILHGNRFPQIPETFWVGQVELLRAVVRQNEGESWILHQVVECSAGKFVELHQVVEVGQSTVLGMMERFN